MAEYEFFTGEDDQFYWRLRGDNGEIMAVSEGYTRPRDAWRAAKRFREGAPDAVLTEDESEGHDRSDASAHGTVRYTPNPYVSGDAEDVVE